MGKIIKLIQSMHEQNLNSTLINKIYAMLKRKHDLGSDTINLELSNIAGEITLSTPVYRDAVDYIRETFINFVIHANDYYVRFVDPKAEAFCATRWGDAVGVTESQLSAITSMYEYAFGVDCDIVDFPEFRYFTGIRQITNQFSNNGGENGNTTLKSIIVPNSVTRIGNTGYGGGFNSTNIESIVIPDNCVIGSASLGDCKQLKYVTLGYGCYLEYHAFQYDDKLENIDLNGATFIGSGCFDGCKSLTSFTIPNTVYEINAGILVDTVNLTSLTFESGNDSNGLTIAGSTSGWEQGRGAFSRMGNSIKTIRFPKRLVELKNNALATSTELNYVFANTTPPDVTGNGSLGYTSKIWIYVPDEALSAYLEAPGFSAASTRIKPVSQLSE